MALIHRYSTELSISQDGHSSIAQIINDVTNCQRKDQEEKRCFHSLNDRLEGLLVDLNNLELANKSLRDQLNILITTWGIGGENRAEFLRDLDVLTRQLSETNLRRIVAQGETKIFEELTRFIDRFTSIYTDISHLYHDKTDFLIDLLQQFEDQFEKIHQRLNKSQSQLDIHHEDYLKDLSKYRSYLSEWSQIALDKQKLLNEIQTLREYLNLRSAFHREELNEWKRLLNRSSQDSEQYYRNYLETIRQQIQIDYEQMAKEQQEDVEIELNTRVKKIQTDLLIEEQTSNTNERFEMYLTEHERLQRDYRILTEEIQAKQRILRELQSKNHQRVHLEHETQLTREEYHQLKDELDQFAYTLRFSIEEELKIYETLLNTIERKTTDYRPLKTQSTRYTIAQSMLGLNEIQCEKRSVQWEEKYLQRRFRINRRYLGNILIKFIDANGYFVDIENTGKQCRDLTGWSVERQVDGQRLIYTFPDFQLNANRIVRIYGNASRRSSLFIDDDDVQRLTASNFPHWGSGQQMSTELFNREQMSKASFEQTIIED